MLKGIQKYGAIGIAGVLVGAVAMIMTQAFGQGSMTGSMALQPGGSLSLTCANALTNANKTLHSETVKCAASASTTTVPASTTTVAPTTTTVATGWKCVTSSQTGHCGFGPDANITGASGDPYVDQNVWNPLFGMTQTLDANGPADWQVVANLPAGNTAVATYPNTGVDYSGTVDSYSRITSSFSENMHKTAQTSGWAMYDLWYNNWSNEVMIQYDFANNGDCNSVATATFGGSNGVPAQAWHLCNFGDAVAWKLGSSEATKGNESTGSIDILAMTKWLESHGYLPKSSTWTAISDGWEICSTGGKSETFTMSSFGVTATK